MIGNISGKRTISRLWQKPWVASESNLNVFLPLFLMKLFVSFNYTILAATKDTIVVTQMSAEAIPVLKVGVVMGAAFLIMILYAKLSNLLTRDQLFYTFLFPFLFFFLLYGYFLFPFKSILIFDKSAKYLYDFVGESHDHWVMVYQNWMDSIFFVLCELWGGLMIGVMFWGFANQVTSLKDAAKFYALYTVGGHVGTIIAGLITYYMASTMKSIGYAITLQRMMLMVSTVGIIIGILYYKASSYIDSSSKISLESKSKLKTKLSLIDSMKFILTSKNLLMISLMVIGYGLSVNMVEVCWKSILKIKYPSSNDYQAYMGILQLVIGTVSIFVALFVGSNIIRKLGWYFSAQTTPIFLSLTSILFFGVFFMFPDYSTSDIEIFGLTPLMLLVSCGMVHNVICKALKYCVFDPTKEMVFIPLDNETKVKGKAAVDLIGSRFGKSGSSFLQLLFIDMLGSGSILSVVPFLVPCVAVAVFFWSFAVNQLAPVVKRSVF